MFSVVFWRVVDTEGEEKPKGMLDITQIAGALTKEAPHVLFVAAASTGIVLFGPDHFVRACHLLEVRDAHGPILGAVFLGASLLFLATAVWPRLTVSAASAREKRRDWKRLCELAEHEKLVLSRYINRQTYTEDFDIDDGVVRNLVRERILYELPVYAGGEVGAFGIEKWARDYLNKNPGLLRTVVPGGHVQDKPPVREPLPEVGPDTHG